MKQRITELDKEKKRLECTNKIDQLIQYANEYTEYSQPALLQCVYVCTNSDLFRGYYHPSPVYDLIVGNTKRGSRRNGNIQNANISHRYLFNSSGSLVCIENMHNGEVACTEFLNYKQNTRIGITIEKNQVRGIAEEQFNNGELVSFSRLICHSVDGQYVPFSLHWEKFFYQGEHLSECELVSNFNPHYSPFTFERYQFESQNGLLTAYTNSRGYQFRISQKREACGKGYFFHNADGTIDP